MNDVIMARPTMRGEQTQYVRVVGELGYESTTVARVDLRHLVDGGAQRIVVDLSGLTFLDSTGLTVFVAAWQRMSREGRHFEVRGATGQPARILATTGCGSLFGAGNDRRASG